MTTRKILMLGVLLGLLSGCTELTQHPDLKSPCAGNDGSPCGPRHPVNDWWLNPGDES